MPETDASKDAKQQLKKDRIKDYFLAAAKDIIMQDGVESLTVRNVANKAGYSYATLYNYFEDLNSLFWQTKLSMILDVFAWLNQATTNLPRNIDGLKKSYEIYMSYYFEHPNVFKFMFSHIRGTMSVHENTSYDMSFDTVMRENFKSFALACKLREEDIPLAYNINTHLAHGLLSLHFSGNKETTLAMAVDEMNQMIDFIFNRKGNKS